MMSAGEQPTLGTPEKLPEVVDWLTPAERTTLEAVCQALIPAVPPPAGEEDRHGLYARAASDLHIARLLADVLAAESPDARAEFKQLLALLSSPAAGLLLAGRPQSFAHLSPALRERALRRMSTSALPQLRQGFQALKRLALFLFYATPTEQGANPNWPALGYQPATPSEQVPKGIKTLAADRDLMLTADVVIVGSGAGGGVIAAELAAAGRDVLILEKGSYYNETDFTGGEAEMMARLYLRRGLLTTKDLSTVVLAGSCLGGGTIVNWNTSLRTPSHVLGEWERVYGMAGATSAAYQRGFAVVEQRLGINTANSEPNPNNAALQRGCQALAYHWSPIARNAYGCAQRCGACGFGCPYGCKQSTMRTFLQDAGDHGARTIPGCTVERILTASGRANGVEGWALDPQTGIRYTVRVRAPVVVAAAGGVESPALLLRSGIDNPNIGLHLRLHPVAAMASRYAEPIEPWSGVPQAVLCDQFADLKDGYGIRIEMAPAHPGLIALTVPWESGQEHKREMTRVRHEATFIALVRDTGEGRVTLDRQGDPVLHYWPNAMDRGRLIRGMQEITRIAVAGGATRVATLHTPRVQVASERGLPGDMMHGQIASFMAAIEQQGIHRNRLPLFSAHQMGACRLGGDPHTAVANPHGEVFGVRGLLIADASGFPTASGVNPMISVMALSYWVAQHIKAHSV